MAPPPERAAPPAQEPDQAQEPGPAQQEPEAPPAHKPRLIKPTALRASPAAMLTAWVPSLACPGSDPAPAGAARHTSECMPVHAPSGGIFALC